MSAGAPPLSPSVSDHCPASLSYKLSYSVLENVHVNIYSLGCFGGRS